MDNMIRFDCPVCGKQMKANPSLAGKRVRCRRPACGQELRVPGRPSTPPIPEPIPESASDTPGRGLSRALICGVGGLLFAATLAGGAYWWAKRPGPAQALATDNPVNATRAAGAPDKALTPVTSATAKAPADPTTPPVTPKTPAKTETPAPPAKTDPALDGVWSLSAVYRVYTGGEKDYLMPRGHRLTVRGGMVEVSGQAGGKPTVAKYALSVDDSAAPKKYKLANPADPNDFESGIYWAENDTVLWRPESFGSAAPEFSFSGVSLNVTDRGGNDAAVPKGFLRPRGGGGKPVLKFTRESAKAPAVAKAPPAKGPPVPFPPKDATAITVSRGILSGDDAGSVSVNTYAGAFGDVFVKQGPPPGTMWFIAEGGLKWQGKDFAAGTLYLAGADRQPRPADGREYTVWAEGEKPLTAFAAKGSAGPAVKMIPAKTRVQLLLSAATTGGWHKVRWGAGTGEEGWVIGNLAEVTFLKHAPWPPK